MTDPKTILLVDDEVNLQTMVALTLKAKQYKVVTANNGVEGLQQLQTIRPDLIILDMNMPKMGGLEFYQKICGQGPRPQYPVLVLTARANMEKLFKEFNIDGFMAKPLEIDDLLKEVETILQKNSGLKKTVSGNRQVKSICIVDHDPHSLSTIGSAFLNAGYTVHPAQNGTEGIERIAGLQPDAALVNLGLDDISGDMVILKLKMMAKASEVKYILYTDPSSEKTDIAHKVADKEGIDCFVEMVVPQDLLDAVQEVCSVQAP